MRDILFRSKKFMSDEWTEGVPLYTKSGPVCVMLNDNDEKYYVLTDTLGQYTGMTDKNGRKIFEGDIVKTHYANTKKNDFVEQIVFQNGKFCSMFELPGGGKMFANLADGIHRLPQDKSVYMEWCEIIGNIHDNPELLKGEEK